MKKKARIRLTIFIVCATLIISGIVLLAVVIFRDPIRGKWVTEDKSCSYEFLRGGELTAGYNGGLVPVLDVEHTGELSGEYSKNKVKDTLTITVNYYSKKVTKTYSYEIENKTLHLKDIESGEGYTYYKEKKR